MTTEKTGWPELPKEPAPSRPDFAKARYQALLDDAKSKVRDPIAAIVAQVAVEANRQDTRVALEAKRLDTQVALEATRNDTQVAREAARQDTEQSAEDGLRAAVHTAYIEVIKGGLDRALKRADYVSTGAGAIGTLYGVLLGLVYSSAKGATALSAVALLPALFLGGAYLFSSYYVAYLRKTISTGSLIPTGAGGQVAELRLERFIEWANHAVLDRVWALRTGVVSLGAALLLLPLPFIQLSGFLTIVLVVGALIVVLGTSLDWKIPKGLGRRT
jgi:hypothetical protein